ncbi:hypothetical protein BN946_scf184983.g57 [Trametes cinnabarina]|uniref:Major facilitator superfamily (MFS) profile domain-containing protein n=1 Tax=Pycnoporus cinnabarinus TaxID=5643 RepID=A0A060SK11_PYCCI|nr:hypothetical protein BN946_scf184983.g57 [Trametes cinnabarina]
MTFPDSQRSLDDKAFEPEAGSLQEKVIGLATVSAYSAASSDDANVGLHEFDIAKQSGVRVTPEQNRRIAKKIDLFLLPMFCIAQGLGFVDKTAVNYGNLYGMTKTLHISGNQFSWLASGESTNRGIKEPTLSRRTLDTAFYLGYLVGNYPDSWLLQRYPAGKVLSITTLLWATIMITTPACTNFASIMANRFFLGVLEAIITPGMTLMTSIWYAQSEVPFRHLAWYSFNGWAGIFGGFLAYGVGHIEHPQIALWKYIFLILGGMCVVFAVILWFFFPDSPVKARFLTNEEKILAVKRVAEAKVGVKNTQFKWYQVKHALVDPTTWILFVATIATQIPNGIITNFSTVLIKSTLLNTVSSAVQIVSMLIAGWILRIITMTACNVTCIIAAASLVYLPSDQRWNHLVSYWFTSFETVGFALSLVMVANNRLVVFSFRVYRNKGF